MSERTVQCLLDADWIVAINEELERNPMGVAFAVEPIALGQYDAECGNACDPVGRGYTRLGDIEMYLVAYKDTSALWAEIVQAKNEQSWLDGELQELVDGMEDDLWHSRGMW